MFTIETLLRELSVSVVLAATTVLRKFLGWFSKGFSPSEHENLKLGSFFIQIMFFKKSIKNVNGRYITDSRFAVNDKGQSKHSVENYMELIRLCRFKPFFSAL